MIDILKGESYMFDYPEVFKTLPDYTAHAGQQVEVLRPAKDGEEYCGPETDPEAGESAFWVRAADGWQGLAFESELRKENEPRKWSAS